MKESDLEVRLNRICQKLTDAENDILIAQVQLEQAKRNNKEAIQYWKALAKHLKVKVWDPNL